MRRCGCGQVQPESVLSGVRTSDSSEEDERPVAERLSIASIGLAPSRPRSGVQGERAASGTRHAAHDQPRPRGARRARTSHVGELPPQKFLRRSMPGVELRHLLGVAVERQRLAPQELADAPLAWPGSSAGGRPPGSRWRRSRTRSAATPVPGGRRLLSAKRILTIDLMPLKPYFHGTTSRSGAPFWLGSARAVEPDREERQRVHRLVDAQRPRRRASRGRRAAARASAPDRGAS